MLEASGYILALRVRRGIHPAPQPRCTVFGSRCRFDPFVSAPLSAPMGNLLQIYGPVCPSLILRIRSCRTEPQSCEVLDVSSVTLGEADGVSELSRRR